MNPFKRILIILFLIFPAVFVQAQAQDYYHNFAFKKSTGHSGTGANIDVKHHRFDWNIDPTQAKRISGSVTTWFETTEDDVSEITFDLNKSAYDNGNLIVKYHGSTVAHSFPTDGYPDILTIELPVTLEKNKLDSVTIFYDGVPPARAGNAHGAQLIDNAGYPLFYTLSESYEDKDWWPCKADMQDKIDSITIMITTPEDYTPAANGVITNTYNDDGYTTTIFKHKYPIASYLVGIAVTQYNIYDRGTVSIGGTDVPIVYYISKGREPTTQQLNIFDACKQELEIFSDLFGEYPYKNEKYGMYEFGFNGGMEHQTFSGMSWSAFRNGRVVPHELMHQWFGNKVTMATWEHLWLSEGFARYSEALACEKVPMLGIDPVDVRASFKSKANDATNRNYGCVIPEALITNSSTLWGSAYGKTVYERGGMVVSMLRTLLGDDLFFQACRNYLNDPALAYKSAVTGDLQAHLEGVIPGLDLTDFFDSFVYGNGYPDYSEEFAVQWQAVGSDKIRFGIYGQKKSTGSNVSYYSAVIPLRIQGDGGKDTLIVLFDRGVNGVSVGGNGITFGSTPTPEVYLGFKPTSVTFDPYAMSLATGTTLQGTPVATDITDFNVKSIYGINRAQLQLTDTKNVAKVTLESSDDGVNFTTLKELNNQGSGTFTAEENIKYTIVYYRAKVLLKSGQTLYSNIIKILPEEKVTTATVLSNPARGTLKVKLPGYNGMLEYRILDTYGRVIAKGTAPPNQYMLEADIHPLSTGVYFLHLQADAWKQTVKFMVNR
ncbi:MAG: T9SS type A sorting domain-containing protein [Chitinophagaceae bacterium]|nr:T9SS type A sorting domain-containing protein [Chitinophagaceae bacterium]